MNIKRTETFTFSVISLSDLEKGIGAAKAMAGDARLVRVWANHARDGFPHSVEITVGGVGEEIVPK